MNPQTFVFIGRSGCGKGTQAKLLISHLENKDAAKRPICYMESGARFREFIKGDSYSSKLSNEAYQNDVRQPDFLAIWNWSGFFIENLTGEEHLMIDGTPRSLPEAMALMTAFNFYGRKVNIVYLNVSNDWSRKLLLARGRSDDATVAKIDKRLKWFDEDVLPGVEFLRNQKQHNFIEIAGEREIADVHHEIVSKLVLQ